MLNLVCKFRSKFVKWYYVAKTPNFNLVRPTISPRKLGNHKSLQQILPRCLWSVVFSDHSQNPSSERSNWSREKFNICCNYGTLFRWKIKSFGKTLKTLSKIIWDLPITNITDNHKQCTPQPFSHLAVHILTTLYKAALSPDANKSLNKYFTTAHFRFYFSHPSNPVQAGSKSQGQQALQQCLPYKL